MSYNSYIIRFATDAFLGSERDALQWLNDSNTAFGLKTPLEHAESLRGHHEVMEEIKALARQIRVRPSMFVSDEYLERIKYGK